MMYGVWGLREKWLLSAAAALLASSAAPAGAADLGDDCCADLEVRVAELEATTARKGTRKISLTVSGYINEALLFWDDGHEQNVYQGTNDSARSRFRFVGDAKINSDWSAGYLLEIGVRSNRLNRTDQDHAHGFSNTPSGPVDAAGLDVRHSAWWLQNKEFGKLWIGKTDQATERITEINLSSTNLFLKHYGRWNGSFRLYRADGTLSTNTWGQILPQSGFTGEGVPGEGDRYNVVKYDSPEISGFTASAAWGEGDAFWDIALRYAGEFGGFKLAGGIGYSDWSDNGPLNLRGCAIDPATQDASCSQLGLSASVLHIETGLFVTGGYGIKWDGNRDAAFGANVDDTDDFYFLNAGVERKFNLLGKTTLYGEWEHYDTGAIIAANGATATALPRNLASLFGVGGTFRGAGTDINVWGLGLNQNIEAAALDLYVAWRRAEADIYGSNNGVKNGPGAQTLSVEPIDLIMTGARIQF
jgi:predicted porin